MKADATSQRGAVKLDIDMPRSLAAELYFILDESEQAGTNRVADNIRYSMRTGHDPIHLNAILRHSGWKACLQNVVDENMTSASGRRKDVLERFDELLDELPNVRAR